MLTEDMSRLREEIDSMRARRESDGRERRESVSDLCSQFKKARAGMAKRTRHDRVSFLRHLRHGVTVQRREFRSDLAGARRAWAA
jgi:hypothetical protein